jgi:hypothetical protein
VCWEKWPNCKRVRVAQRHNRAPCPSYGGRMALYKGSDRCDTPTDFAIGWLMTPDLLRSRFDSSAGMPNRSCAMGWDFIALQ